MAGVTLQDETTGCKEHGAEVMGGQTGTLNPAMAPTPTDSQTGT